MQPKSFLLPVVVGICAAGALFAARGQSGGQFDLSWFTINNGGNTSRGGQFQLSGTIGQHDAGKLTGNSFTLEGGFWSGVTVQQTPGAPLLKLKLLPNGQALISWPLAASGFALEECTALTTAGDIWKPTAQTIVDTTTEHTVTVPAAGMIKFFRLTKQ